MNRVFGKDTATVNQKWVLWVVARCLSKRGGDHEFCAANHEDRAPTAATCENNSSVFATEPKAMLSSRRLLY